MGSYQRAGNTYSTFIYIIRKQIRLEKDIFNQITSLQTSELHDRKNRLRNPTPTPEKKFFLTPTPTQKIFSTRTPSKKIF
jgi:hypothetical protein